jgi:hypothetical protein
VVLCVKSRRVDSICSEAVVAAPMSKGMQTTVKT